MFQAISIPTRQPEDPASTRPVIRLEGRFDILKHETPVQLAADETAYNGTIRDIQTQTMHGQAYAANPNFERLGPYFSVPASSLDADSLSYDALQIFRYGKFLKATKDDRVTGEARSLYGEEGEKNFEQAERTIAAAKLYPDIKSKMIVIDALSNKTLAYDYEKRDFEAEVDQEYSAGLPTGTDDGGKLFNIFASAERTERSHLGICGDAALEKMDMLIQAGVPADRVNVVMLHWISPTNSKFYHVVTLVKAEDGIYVLNNTGDPPALVEDFFAGIKEKRMCFVPEVSFGAGGVNIYKFTPAPEAVKPIEVPPLGRPQRSAAILTP